MKTSQRGGFVMGLIVGLLIGLALALGVALYVTKVPVPFVNKVPQRTSEQDAAEIEKNKNWDPNSPLYGKNPARPNASASGVVAPAAGPAGVTAAVPPASSVTPMARASAAANSRDPAVLLGDKPSDKAGDKTAAIADPSAAKPPRSAASSAGAGADPFTYFVQAGAYGRSEDAEQQRAKLALLGLESRLSEREQAGRTVYRVRLGPFERKDDADATKDKLDGAGIEAALVRVQR